MSDMVAPLCVIGAIVIALSGQDGWWWLLIVAMLTARG